MSCRSAESSFTPITPDTLPQAGDHVAIDAEFVSLAKEEAEIRSDGHKSTVKPAHMACARISVVRGGQADGGLPMLDDYIHTSETVVDYLTQYSGIQPDDLDPALSTRHLTTLKNSYSKLRYLAHRGVIFVGHGLSKDFRVVNLQLPDTQVIDTVNVYYLRLVFVNCTLNTSETQTVFSVSTEGSASSVCASWRGACSALTCRHRLSGMTVSRTLSPRSR